jgi:hypothetical protein
MAYLYAVRCNFARPDLEAAWNDWYSGPKLRQMLQKPMFLSGQRLAASGLDRRRKYLCLWLVQSPDAFATPEYRSDWGFFEWTPHITDWSRDLYRAPFAAFEIAAGEALYYASFDGMAEDAARHLRDRVAPRLPGTIWLEAVGLDRHSPIVGLRRIAAAEPPAPLGDAGGMGETVFTPITLCLRAG